MSRYHDQEVREGYIRSPSHRRGDPAPVSRDHPPEYYSGRGGGPLAYSQGPVPDTGPYIPVAIPVEGANRSYYEPNSAALSPCEMNALQVPSPIPYRPRSVPPQAFAVRRARSPSCSRSRSPIGKARHAIDRTFTQSSSGICFGLLGAVVGGLAAREVSDAAVRSRSSTEMESGTYHPRPHHDTEKARVISTVVGAVVGGLGANALEKRFETARKRDWEQQKLWERRWGRERDLAHYDTGKKHERDHDLGRSRGQHHDDSDRMMGIFTTAGARRD